MRKDLSSKTLPANDSRSKEFSAIKKMHHIRVPSDCQVVKIQGNQVEICSESQGDCEGQKKGRFYRGVSPYLFEMSGKI